MRPRISTFQRRCSYFALLIVGGFTFSSFPATGAEVENLAGSVTFESDVQPLLTRLGCNAGACHGKSRGQNGFALSLLGFDSDFDYAALVSEARGRRVFAAAPEDSLLLRKAVGELPHGGGKRFDVGMLRMRKFASGSTAAFRGLRRMHQNSFALSRNRRAKVWLLKNSSNCE